MTPHDKVLIEVETSFNEFVNVVMKEFGPKAPQSLRDQFMNASTIEDGDLKNLKHTIGRTSRWIKDYQFNSSALVSEQIVDARHAIEQLGSILHIGFAYPDKAAARAIKLRPKLAKK
jgi:hypothetical protein